MSQRELAKALGIAHMTIYRIETGRERARGALIRKLADYFGIPIGELEVRRFGNKPADLLAAPTAPEATDG